MQHASLVKDYFEFRNIVSGSVCIRCVREHKRGQGRRSGRIYGTGICERTHRQKD